MPVFPAPDYQEFVRLAQAAGSGLGRNWHADGALGPLGKLLRHNSDHLNIVAAIRSLENTVDANHVNKMQKYRRAISYVEFNFPVPRPLWQIADDANSMAYRFNQNGTAPTCNFVEGGHVQYGSLTRTNGGVPTALNLSIPDFIVANAGTTRLLIVHLGGTQGDMNIRWSGNTAAQHMSAAIRAAANNAVGVCILRDPHTGARGVGVPTAANAVCPEIRTAVQQVPGPNVWVADSGHSHSFFHDPAFRAWITAPNITNAVVMGYQADICVKANVFGVEEIDQSINPGPQLVPSMLNVVNVVTSRPLLSNDGGAIGDAVCWSTLQGINRD
ncbi:MAG: hypothetical protein AAF439_15645 [Pseudomonadota bacterium]